MKTYVAYKGGEVAAVGTKREVAERLGVKSSTVGWYATPSAKRRGGTVVMLYRRFRISV